MRTPWLLLLLLLLGLSGCSLAAGSLVIGADDDDAADDDDDDDAADDDDTTPASSAWEGTWDGELFLVVADDQYGDSECAGGARLEVDADGILTGDGLCVLWNFLDIEHEFSGVATANGEIEGIVTVSRSGGGGPGGGGGGGGETWTYEFFGDADGGALEFFWEGEWEFGGGGPGGGGGGGSLDIFGEVYAWIQE